MTESEYPVLLELKDRLVWARQRAKMSQGQVARRVGVSTPAISRLENGHDKKTAFIAQFAATLNVDPIWLATGKRPGKGKHISQLQFANLAESEDNGPLEIKKWPEISSGLTMSSTFKFVLQSDLMTGTSGPSIPAGSIITVDPNASKKAGGIFLAQNSGEPVIGALRVVSGRAFLRPSNQQYPAFEIDLSDIIGLVSSYTVDLTN